MLVQGDAQDPVLEHQGHRDLGDGGRVDGVTDEVEGGDAVRVGRRGGQLLLGDDVVVDEHGSDRSAGALGLLGRPVDGLCVCPALFQRVQ
ncbi:hypothetical protein [Dactylosporangium sp. NPDC048998]|uniref:hypothetical protein n=1 Tax=Dactylosporangium sp. NPDC048998 TaxID=3363976 RepID=UPI00371EBE5F